MRGTETGKLYRNARWYGAGRDGCDSRRYPIACDYTFDASEVHW